MDKPIDERIETIRNLKHRNLISDEVATKAMSRIVSVGAPEKKLGYVEMLDGIRALATSSAIDKELALSVINRLSEYEIIERPTAQPKTGGAFERMFDRGELPRDIVDAIKNGHNTTPAVTNFIAEKHGYSVDDIRQRIYSAMNSAKIAGIIEMNASKRYSVVEGRGDSAIEKGKYVREANV